MIKTRELTKTVPTSDGTLQILKPISFSIEAGETVAIVGASGSGKSTLLSLLAGLDTATSGEIELNGQRLDKMDEEQRATLRGQDVGFIFQAFMLVQSLTALENILLPAQIAGLENAEQHAKNILEQVGLSHRADHYPNQLSGGEQQRVAIARAFICKPKILFADEPTGNLDAENGQKVEQLLFSLNRESGTTLVLVTHDTQLAQKCDRQLIMQAGQLSEAIKQEAQRVG
ncbi:ABC transporter ATP-binding protein [Neptunicella marina]|uniref:ABC transporter ATP-binding protein n=1 Tax=Neptunicella marina TaxID=2125989 RepID=A0A8J6ITT2_9ALTE|nr:ABC transporter ATP-binding protein [Neptunicella marina]MBC3767260.1 ABC transporter ATP-binding protein [Neptunicella marina]